MQMNGLIILKKIEQILMQIKLWDKKLWYLRALRATKLIATNGMSWEEWNKMITHADWSHTLKSKNNTTSKQ
jgi:hypothetical protein